LCIGCRVRSAKSDLLRVVAVKGALVPDPRGRLPGRGAHLHPNAECLEQAERRRAFGRALRLTGPYDVSGLSQYLDSHQVTRQDQSRKRADER